ncbi:hypothetical protein GIB67_021521 [Kingdonia uniflora]|uniref:Ribose-phosphate pyrophosphokinase N-terminal domain-containing protein n=1 Tax=Kingdonia uniflora TaxID=39325 RepID=A0A7J7L9I7_9MAGN|nr:hypothetical protein GIB67_021521 [Kingdonia uniflora]
MEKQKQVLLFYCVESEDLAQKIAAKSEFIQLQSINWRSFDDGFPNLFINNAHNIRGQHVAFLASFSSPCVIFEQLSVIFALPRLFVASFKLVLPFFPTGSFERMEEEGDVATAFTMARILSNIPISRGGPTSLVIYDIHALQERFYFGDHVLPCFETGIPLLKQRLLQLPDADNIVIAFPDDGAWKRFYKQLQHYPMVVCTKVREGDKRIVRLKEGNPEGRHVVIVDDLVQSGGTLIECQQVYTRHLTSNKILVSRVFLRIFCKFEYRVDSFENCHLLVSSHGSLMNQAGYGKKDEYFAEVLHITSLNVSVEILAMLDALRENSNFSGKPIKNKVLNEGKAFDDFNC